MRGRGRADQRRDGRRDDSADAGRGPSGAPRRDEQRGRSPCQGHRAPEQTPLEPGADPCGGRGIPAPLLALPRLLPHPCAGCRYRRAVDPQGRAHCHDLPFSEPGRRRLRRPARIPTGSATEPAHRLRRRSPQVPGGRIRPHGAHCGPSGTAHWHYPFLPCRRSQDDELARIRTRIRTTASGGRSLMTKSGSATELLAEFASRTSRESLPDSVAIHAARLCWADLGRFGLTAQPLPSRDPRFFPRHSPASGPTWGR